jgi:hypothetical protein
VVGVEGDWFRVGAGPPFGAGVVLAGVELFELPPSGVDPDGAGLGHEQDDEARDGGPEPAAEVGDLLGGVLVVCGYDDVGEPSECGFGLGAVGTVWA